MTTATLAAIVLIGGFIALMLMRVPVSFAMLLSTLGCALVTGTNLSVLVRQMVDGVNNFSLLSIPFFILMGEIMGAGGISDKIIDLANLAVGRFRGGLAYVNCLSSMFFGGISGSAVADVSSLGSGADGSPGYPLVSAYLTTNAYAEFLQMQNDLNLNIMDIMQADGVEFAFPSTSVYLEKN